MSNTNEAAVEGIVDADDSISLTPFVESAHHLVEEHCRPLDYSEEKLELIERYLSAHFYLIRDTPRQRERAGPVSESFQRQIALGLNQTTYGQMAMRFDSKGALSKLDEQIKKGGPVTVKATWLGKD